METVRNKAMERELKSGVAIDISAYRGVSGRQGQKPIYELPEGLFDEDKDYCDAKTEQWVWSIGKHKETGQVCAALDGRFYLNKDYECLWLR